MNIEAQKKIVFLGATGAVGSVVLTRVLSFSQVVKVLCLGRKKIDVKTPKSNFKSEIIDIHNPNTYAELIHGFNTAICTLGVGEPSKVTKDEFVAIDKTAVLEFANVCKLQGVKHFQLLGSVAVDSNSRNFYLRTKGELIEELIRLNFERLSIFQPSMIITPKNRYGLLQALTLKFWPKLDFILQGQLRKYRGIKVEILGNSIANNTLTNRSGLEYLKYDDFLALQK
ncbi:hypothetical protein DS2_08997 [Catenovulum agarivorans DS-2]|uniref:NAD(P)-binding domain-containing protein n=1 Tax=Catenovulum agarivorans DS-2 TaxID=1328313 RepID=W7QY42_9ALTE|nr:NAD(P)H-binding protein [Catenovulum agarivorans]EWH10225.1 hypothetical protein DS2_08997 [Catenovulum agarivorans DS-2]